MSNPGAGKLANLTVTGNPTVDAALRYGAVALCGVATGAITGFLNAHGFKDPNLVYYVGTGVATVLGGALATAWGLVKASKNETIAKLREAIALNVGINIAENPAVPTPSAVSVPDTQRILAEHGPSVPLPAAK